MQTVEHQIIYCHGLGEGTLTEINWADSTVHICLIGPIIVIFLLELYVWCNLKIDKHNS